MNPIIKPGIKESIGKNTGPINMPNNFIRVEYIRPTVTKYALKTNGRKDNSSFSGIALR